MSTPIHKTLLKLLAKHKDNRSSDILFLENDNCITGDAAVAASNFRDWCVKNRLYTSTLCRVDDLPLEYLKETIIWADTIAFQTTGTRDIAPLKDFIAGYKDMPKIIIECYVYEPILRRLPPNIIHDVYILDSYSDDIEDWVINKLSEDGIID